MKNSNYLKKVKEQYEDLPYPPRDPKNEKKQLITTSLDRLDLVNFYCFEGKQDFNNFRALVVGGGTGDATIFLAEQLKNRKNAEVVHIDLSSSSIKIAKERANVRKLDNITWVQDSLLNLPDLGLAEFDYINCSGVLHHLEDPNAGLEALKTVLKEDGAMGLMIYGKYGRTGIYQMQDLMKIINKGDDDPKSKIDNCKKVVEFLPKTNWFKKGGYVFNDKEGSDAHIFDLLLHSQDRAYTVLETYDYIESSGMVLRDFLKNTHKSEFNYIPDLFIKDPEIAKRVKSLEPRYQQAIAELIAGNITKHVFYASKKKSSFPEVDNLDNIPYFTSKFQKQQQMYDYVYQTLKDVDGNTVSINSGGMKIAFSATVYTKEIFKYLDGKRAIKEIFDSVRKDGKSKVSDDDLLKDFRAIYNAFKICDWMLLKDKSIRSEPELFVELPKND